MTTKNAHSATAPVFLGIDLGTSSLKLIAVDADGVVHGRARVPYSTQTDTGGISEQSAAHWLAALAQAMAQLPAAVRLRVSGIGVDGHVPSVLVVAPDGTPKTPCLTWMDTRAGREATEFAEQLGDPIALCGADVPWVASQLPAKALWLARNQSLTLDHDLLVSPKDYLNAALTGQIASDRWSLKGLCHVGTGRPIAAVLEYGGWPESAIPALVEPWSELGVVLPSVAAELGLPADVRVAGGWTDAMAAVLAVGGFEAPSGVVLSGTTEIVGVTAQTEGSAPGLYTVPRTVAPLPFVYGPTQSGGGSLEWISRLIGQPVATALDLAAQSTAESPTFVPYLDGERAPLWDQTLRGVFVGLHNSHAPGDLVRAVLAGVANCSRQIVDLAASATSTEVTEVNIGGIGSTHPAWLAARGSAFGLPLRLHTEPNLTALGAAMLGALATGFSWAGLSRLRPEPVTFCPPPAEVDAGTRSLARHLRAAAFSIEWSRQQPAAEA